MKISELIKKLMQYNQDMEVYIAICNIECEAGHVQVISEEKGEPYVLISNC